jgi:hypothetical protein
VRQRELQTGGLREHELQTRGVREHELHQLHPLSTTSLLANMRWEVRCERASQTKCDQSWERCMKKEIEKENKSDKSTKTKKPRVPV